MAAARDAAGATPAAAGADAAERAIACSPDVVGFFFEDFFFFVLFFDFVLSADFIESFDASLLASLVAGIVAAGAGAGAAGAGAGVWADAVSANTPAIIAIRSLDMGGFPL